MTGQESKQFCFPENLIFFIQYNTVFYCCFEGPLPSVAGAFPGIFGSTHKVGLILNCTDHSQKYIYRFNHILVLKYQLKLIVLSSNVSTSCPLQLHTLYSVSSSILSKRQWDFEDWLWMQERTTLTTFARAYALQERYFLIWSIAVFSITR